MWSYFNNEACGTRARFYIMNSRVCSYEKKWSEIFKDDFLFFKRFHKNILWKIKKITICNSFYNKTNFASTYVLNC